MVPAVGGIVFKLPWQLVGSCSNYPELDLHMLYYWYVLGTLDLICRSLAMLGSSIRALVARITIQKRALKETKRAHVRAKRGSRASRPCVRSSRVLHRLGIVRVALATVQ